jgi:CheY-like chemotaxis protein
LAQLTVAFPTAQGGLVPQGRAESSASGKPASKHLAIGRCGPGVLIVLHDPGERRSLAEFLGSNGFDAVAIDRPEQAFEEVQRAGFAVVIADLCLPGLTGVELANRLRRMAPDTEVILLSGLPSSSAPRRGKCERLGMVGVLERPFDPALLLTMVSEAAAGKRSDRLATARRRSAGDEEEPRSPCVLILEDSEDLRGLIGEVLSSRGFQAVHSAALDEAREHLVGEDFDLVIADLWVPGGDGGPSTIRQLRKADPHVPIVAMTGSEAPAEILRSAGAAGCLTKPFAIKDLVELLDRLGLDGRPKPLPRRRGRIPHGASKGGA